MQSPLLNTSSLQQKNEARTGHLVRTDYNYHFIKEQTEIESRIPRNKAPETVIKSKEANGVLLL